MYRHITLESLREIGIPKDKMDEFKKVIDERDKYTPTQSFPAIKDQLISDILTNLKPSYDSVDVLGEKMIRATMYVSSENVLQISIKHETLGYIFIATVCLVGSSRVEFETPLNLVKFRYYPVIGLIINFVRLLSVADLKNVAGYLNNDCKLEDLLMNYSYTRKYITELTGGQKKFAKEINEYLKTFQETTLIMYGNQDPMIAHMYKILKEAIENKVKLKYYTACGNMIILKTVEGKYLELDFTGSKEGLKSQILELKLHPDGMKEIADIIYIMPRFNDKGYTLEDIIASTMLHERSEIARNCVLHKYMEDKKTNSRTVRGF